MEDCAFYLKEDEGKRKYGMIEQQAQALVFPMERVFGTAGGFSEWQNRVLRIRGGDAIAGIINFD